MELADVCWVMDCLGGSGIAAWVGGGWGVDVLAGRQTRPHQDLDLAVDAARTGDAVAALTGAGFVVSVDWLPVRVELTHPVRGLVDLHPVDFRPDGSGVQQGLDGVTFDYAADGFSTGRVAGRILPCLSAAQQLRFREGYRWRDVDSHDVRLLLTFLRR